MDDPLKELIDVLESIVDRLSKKETLSYQEVILATDAKLRLDVLKTMNQFFWRISLNEIRL